MKFFDLLIDIFDRNNGILPRLPRPGQVELTPLTAPPPPPPPPSLNPQLLNSFLTRFLKSLLIVISQPSRPWKGFHTHFTLIMIKNGEVCVLSYLEYNWFPFHLLKNISVQSKTLTDLRIREKQILYLQ